MVLSVLPRRLQPGQRAAIRLVDLAAEGSEFTLRVELFSDAHYRLLGPAGQPLDAETAAYYLLDSRLQPMAYIEALVGSPDRPLNVYIRPIELRQFYGQPPPLRRVTQRVELWSLDAFGGRLTLRMHRGVGQQLTADMARIALRLSLTGSVVRPPNEFSALTVQLQGMATGDGAVVPAGPFEITASGIVEVATDVLVILGDSGETTLSFSVSGLPLNVAVSMIPKTLRVTWPTPPDLDVNGDGTVGTEDVVLLLIFMAGERNELPQRTVAAEVQTRLENLMPPEVVDLRLDFDNNGEVNTSDVRILMPLSGRASGCGIGTGCRAQAYRAAIRSKSLD